MNARRWQVWLIFAGVFLAGGVAGGFLSQRVALDLVERGRSRSDFAPRMFNRLVENLDLTEEQQAAIRPLIDDAWEQLHQYRRLSGDVMRKMEEAIADVLTDEQKQQLADMQAQRRERWERLMERRGQNKHHGGESGRGAGSTPPGAPPGD